MSNKSIVALLVLIIVGVTSMVLSSHIIETVEKGTYVIKQAAVSGELSAHMQPGMFMQNFGDVTIFPKGYTYTFIKDSQEGGSENDAINVTFSDGSQTPISGSVRIIMPKTERDAIALVGEHGYPNMEAFREDLIKKHVRTAIRSAATLMTAQESYNTKRPEYYRIVLDMLNRGQYKTKQVDVDTVDLLTGKTVTKQVVAVMYDSSGQAIIAQNPTAGLGVSFSNVDIKSFAYPDRIITQINQQQKAFMGIATAAAEAKEAEQTEKTAVARGKAEVARIKYTEEAEKIKKVVKAQALKEEAIIKAEQQKEVAELDKDAARFTKEKEILLGEGEASRKKAVLMADGALAQKLATYERVHGYYAQQIGKHKWVPNVVIGGNGNGEDGNAAMNLVSLMSAKFANDLNLDLNLAKTK